MWRTLRSEWGKTWSLRAPWICLVATAVLVAVTASSLANDFVYGIGIAERPASARMALMDAVGPALNLGQVAFAAFAMQLVTAEYASGAIRSTLLAQPRRVTLVVAKAAVAGVCGLVVGAGSGVLAAWASRLLLAEHLATGAESFLLVALRSGALMATVGILVVAIGALLRSAVGTLAAASVMLIGTLVVPTALGRWLPGQAGASFLSGAGEPYPGVVGLLVVTAWAVLLLGLGVAVVVRRDA